MLEDAFFLYLQGANHSGSETFEKQQESLNF